MTYIQLHSKIQWLVSASDCFEVLKHECCICIVNAVMITKIKINQKEKSLKPLSRKKKKVIVKKKALDVNWMLFSFFHNNFEYSLPHASVSFNVFLLSRWCFLSWIFSRSSCRGLNNIFLSYNVHNPKFTKIIKL